MWGRSFSNAWVRLKRYDKAQRISIQCTTHAAEKRNQKMWCKQKHSENATLSLMPIFRNGKIPLKFLDPHGDPDHDQKNTEREATYFPLFFSEAARKRTAWRERKRNIAKLDWAELAEATLILLTRRQVEATYWNQSEKRLTSFCAVVNWTN